MPYNCKDRMCGAEDCSTCHPERNPCCGFCGAELDDSAVTQRDDGVPEWMCNVCGETGIMEKTK